MRARLADYQLSGPAGPDGHSWAARAPERLGSDGPVVLVEITGADWPALSDRLTALAGVRSPHLPTLIEAGQVVEDGETVTWVARSAGVARPDQAPTDPWRTLRLLAGAARGAHDLHQAGLIHGAIGPASVLEDGDRGLLDLPFRAGPPAVPPEAATDLDPIEPALLWGEHPSRAGDIWSLGATAHQLLTGQLLHPDLRGDSLVTGLQRILLEPPTVAPSLPTPVAEAIRSCLATDPAARPPTAADLADRFEQLVAH